MRRSPYMFATMAMVLIALLFSSGCKPKPPEVVTPKGEGGQAPPQPPPPPAAAPTITLQASPSAIQSGQKTTLTWSSTNATGVTIDNNVGTVEPSGSRTVGPEISTTYKASATGPGGNAVAEARVTVEPRAVTPPREPDINISDIAYFEREIRDAFFDYDQYGIREDARAALMKDVQVLKERPKIAITIEGYCDERGSDKYNLALGDSRANAARDFLVNQGISASRIDTLSYGKEKNFCEEHTEECWQSNRRAHFVMHGSQ